VSVWPILGLRLIVEISFIEPTRSSNGKGGTPLKKIILVLFCCLLIPWSVEAKDKVINLEYIPRDKVKVSPKNVPTEKIYFEEVKDTRSPVREIGENKENKGKTIKILISKDEEAGNFLLSVLKNEFLGKGFRVENSFNEASKIIGTTLLTFWTLEDSRYNSEIQLKFEIREKNGETSFQKTYSATGTNSGRSLSEGNYNESYSDAIARIVEKIFTDSDFLRVLSEKPKPPRVDEKKIEALKAEERRLEALKAEERRLEELKAETKRLEEKKAEEKRLEEKRLEDLKAEAKRLEELKAEVKRLEEIKAEEKRTKERQEEEKKIEELKAEVKKLEELKALKEEILAEEKRAEEKKREEEKRAKEKRSTPAKPKPADPVFGPK
jgi:flagellar biosynthesis GTPase FlhF